MTEIPEWEVNDGPFDPEDEPTPEDVRKFDEWLAKNFFPPSPGE